jgi:hypothetical protein
LDISTDLISTECSFFKASFSFVSLGTLILLVCEVFNEALGRRTAACERDFNTARNNASVSIAISGLQVKKFAERKVGKKPPLFF